jgi:transcriptional regulator with XRE-family HTH domain
MAETLGDRMRMHRARLQLSQKDLGKQVGLSANSISALELGQVDPRVEVIRRVAKALGVTFLYLVGEDDDSEPLPTSLALAASAV